MKFYDFLDKEPEIGKLVIIEGEERALADRALDVVVERLLPADVRDMNLDRFSPATLESGARLREAAQAMPFLAERRLVVVTDAQMLKAAVRREVWEAAQNVPEGSTLVLCDLLSPRSKRPEPFGAMAGRSALRIDTGANDEVRTRFIEDLLRQLRATAEPRVVDALARSTADLGSVRNDLEKLAIGGKRITYDDLMQETITIEDPKTYRFAGALVEGRTAEALSIARELFANDSRAGVPLVSALATECGWVWELARRGGTIPERYRWRERALRPVAARMGEARARRAYERAVAAFDALVTGKIEDPEVAVDMLSAEVAALAAPR